MQSLKASIFEYPSDGVKIEALKVAEPPKFGLIDKNGQYILKPLYNSIKTYEDTYYIALWKYNSSIFDLNGKWLLV